MVLKLKNAAIKTFRLGRGFIIPERAGKSYPFQREKVWGILEVWKGGEGCYRPGCLLGLIPGKRQVGLTCFGTFGNIFLKLVLIPIRLNILLLIVD